MQITLDPASLAAYLTRGITKLHVFFVQKGCSGTKVDVTEIFDTLWLVSHTQWSGLTIYTMPGASDKLDNGRLTKAGNKWIFTSGQVQSRCGCGSSFSFEKQSIDQAKLKNIAKLFRKQSNITELASHMKQPICED